MADSEDSRSLSAVTRRKRLPGTAVAVIGQSVHIKSSCKPGLRSCRRAGRRPIDSPRTQYEANVSFVTVMEQLCALECSRYLLRALMGQAPQALFKF